MFQVVFGLPKPECDEFSQWIRSAHDAVQEAVMLEYAKIRSAGLSRDSARFFYEGAYETHVVPYDLARVYFLFTRPIADNRVVSLGRNAISDGEERAIAMAYERTCRWLSKPSLRGYRVMEN
jgi:hypothetical protein